MAKLCLGRESGFVSTFQSCVALSYTIFSSCGCNLNACDAGVSVASHQSLLLRHALL